MAPAILLALAGLSCGGDSGPAAPCLIVRVDNVAVAQPAKVTAFFTVDKCTGEPVTDLTAAEVEIREDGSKISSAESQQRLVRNPTTFRVYSILVLDLTASIVRGGQLTAVQDGAKALAASLTAAGPEHQVAVYTFDGRPKLQLVQAFTNDGAMLDTAIARLSTRQCFTSNDCVVFPDHSSCVTGGDTGLCLDESTNLYGALVEGITTLDMAVAAATTVPFKIGALVLFTDSADQAALVTRQTAISKASSSQDSIYGIAVGTEADRDFLGLVARAGTASATTVEDLGAAFTSIAEKIKQQAGRHYLLEYCSPKRAGSHELTVNATKDTATGGATSTFSAQGFTSGCSLN